MDANGSADAASPFCSTTRRYERVSLPYVADRSSKLGIDARVRTVDPAQYQHLTDDFDFDMIIMIYPEGDVPGNELRDYLTCTAAKAQGSFNVPGSAIRPSMRWSSGSSRRRTARTARRRRARWTGCCCGAGTWCRTGTAGCSTSPTGIASAIRTSRSARASTSIRGGWTGEGCGHRRGKAAVQAPRPDPLPRGDGEWPA